MTLCAEETFGPVVSVYPFRTEDEAVDRANATAYGLNASIWTKDTRRGRRLGARIQAGTVNINEGYGAGWASLDAPMGGLQGLRVSAAGTAAKASSSTPRRRRLPPSGSSASTRRSAWATRPTPKFLTTSMRLMRRNPFIK